ncbi:MAG: hypothetical protein H7101_04090 [Deinococcales bacterium]|nr:hypothetical protein [Chitinophagaceae bacterium]
MKETVFLDYQAINFVSFLKLSSTKKFVALSLVISVLIFIVGRLVIPIPNFYYDSFRYIDWAKNDIIVSIRPTTYSRIISFFKFFSNSDIALVVAQYACNYVSNLFLFVTAIYFFPFKKISKRLLFIVLFLNPLYFITSNIILSDSFFCALAVIWISILIWLIKFPKWYLFAAETLLLIVLFKLRYHGIIFPIILFIALIFFIKIKVIAKILVIGINFFLLFLVINDIKNTNQRITGIKIFSAFGGWQMASNAMYILQNNSHQVNTNMVINADDDTKQILHFVKHYYDTSKNPLKTYLPRGLFLWEKSSPLNKYLELYAQENHLSADGAWQKLGPIYNKFGWYVINKNPVAYYRYWVLPNFLFYFASSPEAYLYYCNNNDTIPEFVANYYNYKTNVVSIKTRKLYFLLTSPIRYINSIINILFIFLTLIYLKTFGINNKNFFTKALLLFAIIYIINLAFISALAPTVLRYHLFIFTLAIPFLIGIIETLTSKFNNKYV